MVRIPPSFRLPLLAGALALLSATAAAEDFPPERIKAGASIYSRNCSPCHGTNVQNPEAPFNLSTFPPEQHERFVNSVTNGKDQMPPWGDLLKRDDIESLWAFIMVSHVK